MTTTDFGRRSKLFLPPYFGHFSFRLLSSHSTLKEDGHIAGQFQFSLWERKGQFQQIAAGLLGEEGSASLSSLHLYPLLNEKECLGTGYLWFLSP